MSRPSTVNTLYPPSTAHTSHTFSGAHSASRTLTLWIHDPEATAALSKYDAVLNYDLFPPGIAKPGDIAEVKLFAPGAPGATIMSESTVGLVHDGASAIVDLGVTSQRMERRPSYTTSVADLAPDKSVADSLGRPAKEGGGTFLFVIRELDEAQRKTPNLQVVVARSRGGWSS